MNIFCIIFIIVLVLLVVYLMFFRKPVLQNNNLSLQTKESDMDLLYDSLYRCFLTTLKDFSVRDFLFSTSSPISNLYSGKYRDLIQYLLRPDIKLSHPITNPDGSEETIDDPFFDYFIKKIYLMYISETPEYIKNLLYKYYSGYTIDTYYDKKKEKTCLPFITEYVRNKLWIRHTEAEMDAQALLEDAKAHTDSNSLDNYAQVMNDYDILQLRKINLDIYHMSDNCMEKQKYLNLSYSSKTQSNTDKQTETDSKKNMFKADLSVNDSNNPKR